MTLLDQLSSKTSGHKTGATRWVTPFCLADPALLHEIAAGLRQPDALLQADCAEVLTMTAEQRPDLVAPFAADLLPLLDARATRARWEAMHALALIADRVSEVLTPALPQIRAIIQRDGSIIVRDYAVDALARYAAVDAAAALRVYPLLLEALDAWEGRHAGRALPGLTRVGQQLPDLRPAILAAAAPFQDSGKAVVRKAAKILQKALA